MSSVSRGESGLQIADLRELLISNCGDLGRGGEFNDRIKHKYRKLANWLDMNHTTQKPDQDVDHFCARLSVTAPADTSKSRRTGTTMLRGLAANIGGVD